MPDQPKFTAREHEVARLLTQRYTNEEIAEELGISPRTAEWHVSNVIGKLGAANRREAQRILKNT